MHLIRNEAQNGKNENARRLGTLALGALVRASGTSTGAGASTEGTFVNRGTSKRGSSMHRRLLDRGVLGTDGLGGCASMSSIRASFALRRGDGS